MTGNRHKKTDRTPYPGVTWDDRLRKYRVSFYAKGEKAYLGSYEDLDKAINARKKAEEAYSKIDPGYRTRSDNRSGVPGMYKEKRSGKWVVKIKDKYYGSFTDRHEAEMVARMNQV